LAGALREIEREARHRPDSGEHPTPATLAAYRAGTLGPRAAQAVREHLVVCCDCPELLLDLDLFLAPPADPGEDTRTETEAAWRRLRPWLEKPWLRERLLAGLRRLWPDPSATLAAVPVLLLLLCAGGLQILHLYGGLVRAQAPAEVVALEELEPPPVVRGPGPGPVAELGLPAQDGAVVLILHAGVPGAEPARYRVEILAPDGAAAVRLDRVAPDRSGDLRISFARHLLRAGEHRVRISRPGGARPATVQEYALRVVDLAAR
jgi:hypothetical protein